MNDKLNDVSDATIMGDASVWKWFDDEIRSIKSQKFHYISGPLSKAEMERVYRSDLPVSDQYKEFIVRYGSAKLFRNQVDHSYRMIILPSPRETRVAKSSCQLIGYLNGMAVVFNGKNSIFTVEANQLVERCNYFDWFINSYKLCKSEYTVLQWRAIQEGPMPFSDQEQLLLTHRNAIAWKYIGATGNGMYRFSISNFGSTKVDYITIGVRSDNGKLNGAIKIDVRDIKVNQTAVKEIECYKGILRPEAAVFFGYDDITPEDREFFYEFKSNGLKSDNVNI